MQTACSTSLTLWNWRRLLQLKPLTMLCTECPSCRSRISWSISLPAMGATPRSCSRVPSIGRGVWLTVCVKRGYNAVALQGNMSQQQRDRAMRGFRDRRYDILVATDIASRGIDVSGVSHVINFDVPTTPETYTHRIGRTGRGEREGVAYTFVTPDDGSWLRATERIIGSPIPQRKADGFVFDHSQTPGKKTTPRRRRPGRPKAKAGCSRSRPSIPTKASCTPAPAKAVKTGFCLSHATPLRFIWKDYLEGRTPSSAGSCSF